jgi:amino acid transporter
MGSVFAFVGEFYRFFSKERIFANIN